MSQHRDSPVGPLKSLQPHTAVPVWLRPAHTQHAPNIFYPARSVSPFLTGYALFTFQIERGHFWSPWYSNKLDFQKHNRLWAGKPHAYILHIEVFPVSQPMLYWESLWTGATSPAPGMAPFSRTPLECNPPGTMQCVTTNVLLSVTNSWLTECPSL